MVLGGIKNLSDYILVIARPVEPIPGIPGISNSKPAFIMLSFYVKTGILPLRRRFTEHWVQGYDKIEFYDKSSFPTTNAKTLFCATCCCSGMSWPPPKCVHMNVNFAKIILKKDYHLRCLVWTEITTSLNTFFRLVCFGSTGATLQMRWLQNSLVCHRPTHVAVCL